ncbi:MAG: endo-1,4-beta-xylanase [Candidatus Marinimicrobia bacterium]|nr:endo-1,4-beta-xylanase [Candidatus Neomarinimicrobiota bacterium]MCF7850930.1 endo-1,4-beta-xylanase [Candidatus Neomarinimicrobiota bacterium]MCF7905501.1 endo-1,4-beta-xylanase [Candidatus Neomarinimicrobiota bacterium]
MSPQNSQAANERPCPCEADVGGAEMLAAGNVLLSSKKPSSGELLFKPWLVQRGSGPHINSLVYASDMKWDTIPSDISLRDNGLVISDTEGERRFGINVRWNVEGFGAGYILADNGGEFYELPGEGKTRTLNLNYELAASRHARNSLRLEMHREHGWRPSRETRAYLDLSADLMNDARKLNRHSEACAIKAQRALYYAMWGGEMLELDHARWKMVRRSPDRPVFIGCDARQYYQVDNEPFMESFTKLFDYANVSFVVNGDRQMNELEPREGVHDLELRDSLIRRLNDQDIQVGARALFWFHKWVTPDWLRSKSFPELKKYVESHTRALVSHFGDRVYAWEIVNEFHDWANAVGVTPEQAVELTGLACDVARDSAPNVKLLINNCCPFAEYVQMREWSSGKARYPQRSPWEFTRDLIDAGVDFDLIGQQMYFPWRDLQDSIIMLERYQSFDKKVQLSEVGTSAGPLQKKILTGEDEIGREPYIWHRPWDEELQADWLEGIYSLAYAADHVEAVNWFDHVDTNSYMQNGGIIDDSTWRWKPAAHRLQNLKQQWRKS